ncbi:putative shikimate kinase I [Citrobacter youngae ATCC 29220]|uniref:Putative shikimate kinase I n=1 Tax=Citrobacter youngae ATCC 29220 TaxID=500640 RepID=D4BI15_9ENTR|nr:putative shikimate kinase I [Citrobacter youngae ATCC 29220]
MFAGLHACHDQKCVRFGDLFSCQTRLSIEIIFSLTLAISYEVSVHVLLRWVSAKRVYH